MRKKAIILIDGACSGNPGPMSMGAVIKGENEVIWYHKDLGDGTNNIAEWTALCESLKLASLLGYNEAEVITDSQLVCEQFNGTFKINKEELRQLYKRAKGLCEGFFEVKVRQGSQEEILPAHKVAHIKIKKEE
jgi:ribonuclease HI